MAERRTRQERDPLAQLEQAERALNVAQGRPVEIVCCIMLTGDAGTVARFSRRVVLARLWGRNYGGK